MIDLECHLLSADRQLRVLYQSHGDKTFGEDGGLEMLQKVGFMGDGLMSEGLQSKARSDAELNKNLSE